MCLFGVRNKNLTFRSPYFRKIANFGPDFDGILENYGAVGSKMALPHYFGQWLIQQLMLTDFQKCFTFGLSSDCVMNFLFIKDPITP